MPFDGIEMAERDIDLAGRGKEVASSVHFKFSINFSEHPTPTTPCTNGTVVLHHILCCDILDLFQWESVTALFLRCRFHQAFEEVKNKTPTIG